MKFNKYFDHTNLKPEATRDDIRKLCEEAKTNDFASVCVNGIYTAYAKECLAGSDVKTCVVVGFPLGAMSTDAKAYETRKAVEDGADEIDMVISVGQLKAGSYDEVYEDVKAVREACQGKVLKLIFENCLLTDEEKIKACEMVITFYHKDNIRRDSHNYLKQLLDALVEANIIVDDNDKVIQKLTIIGKIDKRKPRIEIDIEEISGMV